MRGQHRAPPGPGCLQEPQRPRRHPGKLLDRQGSGRDSKDVPRGWEPTSLPRCVRVPFPGRTRGFPETLKPESSSS